MSQQLSDEMLCHVTEMLQAQQQQQEARIAELLQQQKSEMSTQLQQMQQSAKGPAISTDSGKHKMKVKLEYDHSNSALYPAFESQLIAKLRIDGHLIGGEAEQVWFAFGCLQGTAKARIHPWMKAYENNAEKFTRNEFVLQMIFAAEESGFSRLFSEFDQTLLEAGAFGESETTKKSWLRNAISFDIARAVVAVPEAATYEEYCQQLHRVAHQLASLNKRAAPRQTRFPRQSDFQPNSSPQPQPTDAMDWTPSANKRRAKWVSLDELDKRMKEGRCRRCGATGHIIKDCPYDPPRRPNTPSLRVNNATTIEPELEDDEGYAKKE
ncbi:hypothetical protein V1525DRAFT_392218 [Lipomyces kononenkoae]|uniref:Uncharacterized protein n=1 Tax=Lipomyces kononenkoae TaxID=34357 RepID=A0ACC3SPY4_LIPKO